MRFSIFSSLHDLKPGSRLLERLEEGKPNSSQRPFSVLSATAGSTVGTKGDSLVPLHFFTGAPDHLEHPPQAAGALQKGGSLSPFWRRRRSFSRPPPTSTPTRPPHLHPCSH